MSTPTQGAATLANSAFSSPDLPSVSQQDLPLDRAYRWERERPNSIFLTQPRAGHARDWTWAQTLAEARRMAAYLESRNWPPHSRIVILSRNCAWWIMAELATWMAGHVTVPLYASLSASSIRSLMDHCEPVACFIGSVDDQRILTEGIPPGIPRISFPGADDPKAIEWDAIIAATSPIPRSPVRSVDDLATIIYTSGTTGTPKGAMHRFAAFVYLAMAEIRVVGDRPDHRMFSYLPLAHIAERGLVEASAFYLGARLFFLEKVETFIPDLKRARPTIFFSVPRLYLKLQRRVLDKVPQPKLDRLLRIPVLSRIVRRRILGELGLNTIGLASSGGAALPLATLEWYRKLGLSLVEGYGMTETGITHTPRNGESRPGYVGDGVPGVQTRIAENGEVLIKSPMNMIGYYKDPEGTRQAFTDDGFFKTGDLGELSSDGWLKIVGRVKEQFKTTKGKYISPGHVEKLLSTHPLIESCCVMGAGMASPFALVLLSESARSGLFDEAKRTEVEQSLMALRQEVNRQLDGHERLGFLVVISEAWSIENGFLTPTMKLRRTALEARYAVHFERWMNANRAVVWETP